MSSSVKWKWLLTFELWGNELSWSLPWSVVYSSLNFSWNHLWLFCYIFLSPYENFSLTEVLPYVPPVVLFDIHLVHLTCLDPSKAKKKVCGGGWVGGGENQKLSIWIRSMSLSLCLSLWVHMTQTWLRPSWSSPDLHPTFTRPGPGPELDKIGRKMCDIGDNEWQYQYGMMRSNVWKVWA